MAKPMPPLSSEFPLRTVHRLRRDDLPVDTVKLARYLIGKTLVHDLPRTSLSGRIVETEAYVIGDAAGHAFRGPTPRNRSLFLERGHAYVYFVYGCWNMMNVSAECPGVGAGVLLRAIEPLEGVNTMLRLGGTRDVRSIARGPGRLATAMRIDRRHDGLDLCGEGPVWLGSAARRTRMIGTSVRIGLSVEIHRVLRFYERDNPFVSGPKRLGV
jgi:DNA-3-methyladenine glycosylase